VASTGEKYYNKEEPLLSQRRKICEYSLEEKSIEEASKEEVTMSK